jgi:hypothetical protein
MARRKARRCASPANAPFLMKRSDQSTAQHPCEERAAVALLDPLSYVSASSMLPAGHQHTLVYR